MLARCEFFQLELRRCSIGELIAGCTVNTTPLMQQTAHRPWPLPQTPWFLFMRWHDVLFLHWRVRPEIIRALIPTILELDMFEDWCWIGVAPFRMSGVRPRYIPISIAFPEFNVCART